MSVLLKPAGRLILYTALSLCLAACERTVIIAPDAILPDGSQYLGDIKAGQFHGHGKLVFAGGGYYLGEFNQGLFHGQGLLVDVNGNRYQGQFDRGRATGKFAVHDVLSDQRYVGDLVDYVYQGQGRLEFGEYFYQGGFKKFRYHGQGTLSVESGLYKGQFINGEFTGQGRFESADGMIHEGQFENGQLHGEGKQISAEGDVLEASFERGYAQGVGHYTSEVYGRYEGEFDAGQFHGKGTYTQTDGAVYVGDFEYGQYHGDGRLTKAAVSGTTPEVIVGTWRYGTFQGANGDREEQQRALAESQAELALKYHQSQLDEVLSALKHSEQAAVYFVGFAGDGTQSVFRREVEFVQRFFARNYGAAQRSVSLINDHQSAQKYPLATRLSFTQSIDAIAKHAKLEQDVLVVYLTSHGSETHSLSVQHDAVKLPDMTAKYLSEVLASSGFKHKLVFVSACFSGGYIDDLDDGNTTVITAASDTTTSFGCSDDSELTFFARALFSEVLKGQPGLDIHQAFEQAKELIERWEQEQELTASKPQIKTAEGVLRQLKTIREAQQL